MATGPIVAKLEELKALVQQVFELKRMQDRMNMDMKSALQRKQYLELGDYVDEMGASGGSGVSLLSDVACFSERRWFCYTQIPI